MGGSRGIEIGPEIGAEPKKLHGNGMRMADFGAVALRKSFQFQEDVYQNADQPVHIYLVMRGHAPPSLDSPRSC